MVALAALQIEVCSVYRNGRFHCAPECAARGGVWPATPEFFARNKEAKRGLGSWCRLCEKSYWQTPQYKAQQHRYRTTLEFKARRRTPQAHEKARAYFALLRARVLAAYGDQCVDCGVPEGLQIHHIWGRGDSRYPAGPLRDRGSQHLCQALISFHKNGGVWPPGFELRCGPCHHRWLLAAMPTASADTIRERVRSLKHALRAAQEQLQREEVKDG
jgi:hypothetical protein